MKMDKKRIVQEIYEVVDADVKKQRVRGCCQRTILALQDVFQMNDDGLFRTGSGLHGGIGFMRDVCGSLIGACIVLGYRYGLDRYEDRELKPEENPTIFAGKMYKWFEKEFGTNNCRELVTRHAGGVYYDSSVPWQQKLAIEAGVYDKCDLLIKKTAAKAAELICDYENKTCEHHVLQTRF